ncbi:MAG: hypothetical protein K0S61_3231 [Anaerocolumna sp.]|jgi:regulator of cell morphogenesis and NO signaling|nr:hypothetical protein [Anaerocolumna sp.]
MNYLNNTLSIGEVVASNPLAADIFKEYGIDFCCGGHKPLLEIVGRQGVNKEELIARLEEADIKRKEQYSKGEHFDEMSPIVLSAYIEDTHHSYLRKVLPEALELLSTIMRVHGKNHRELFKMYQLFGSLKTDLEQHLLKEENLLFPILYNSSDNIAEVKSLTNEIITEHELAGEILRELRRESKEYSLPLDACATYHKVYDLLIEIEGDLHQHIHLENNILLKEYSNR